MFSFKCHTTLVTPTVVALLSLVSVLPARLYK